MKLRNKETKDIIEVKLIMINDKYLIDHEVDTIYGEPITVKALNKYYEDYTLAEPLIVCEKERNVIRTWADAVNITEVIYDKIKDCIYVPDCDNTVSISFDKYSVFEKLKHGQSYTITELCGEEKKC